MSHRDKPPAATRALRKVVADQPRPPRGAPRPRPPRTPTARGMFARHARPRSLHEPRTLLPLRLVNAWLNSVYGPSTAGRRRSTIHGTPALRSARHSRSGYSSSPTTQRWASSSHLETFPFLPLSSQRHRLFRSAAPPSSNRPPSSSFTCSDLVSAGQLGVAADENLASLGFRS